MTTIRILPVPAALLAALFTATLAVAQQPPVEVETPAPAPAPAGADATARLRGVLDDLDSLRGVRGEERRTRLGECAAAFDAIATDFANQVDVVARATWEAGECRRRAGDVAAAEASYARCIATGVARYLERATFEHASMLRRQKRFAEAIEGYGKVAGMRADSGRAHEARIWIGRCQEGAGELDAAVTTYRGAVEAATTPLRKVDACDRLGRLLVRRGDLDGAAEAIANAERAAAPVIDAGGKNAERMVRTLEELGARRALQRARDRADDAGGDAARLEADRSRRGAGGS